MADVFALCQEYLEQHPNISRAMMVVKDAQPALTAYLKAVEAMTLKPTIVTTAGTWPNA